MTRQQREAMRSPCFEAEETRNRRFSWVVITAERTFSVVLTANIGLE